MPRWYRILLTLYSNSSVTSLVEPESLMARFCSRRWACDIGAEAW